MCIYGILVGSNKSINGMARDIHTSSFQSVSLDKIKRHEEEARAQLDAQGYGFPYLDLVHVPVTLEALVILDEKTSRAAQMAVLQRRGPELEIAVHNPELTKTKEIIEGLKQQSFKINLFIASKSGLDFVREKYRQYVHKKE